MTIDEVKRQLVPGTNFKFVLPGHIKNLTVKSNDGETLTADVVGEEGKQVTWSLVGLDFIDGISI
jgi:hypothetical protein